ncbi:hypothetical protein L1987_49358 [Smallanthus sonchifolius]|uniref:Uncharacterized protein n=1 Tax=Smallanthus sonchifolius TaxID=185202 RepID=A0ACB9FVF6_9ASTR|nr:hypothetical protein L1987_49358 [Smallanthus sonchifolius]
MQLEINSSIYPLPRGTSYLTHQSWPHLHKLHLSSLSSPSSSFSRYFSPNLFLFYFIFPSSSPADRAYRSIFFAKLKVCFLKFLWFDIAIDFKREIVLRF